MSDDKVPIEEGLWEGSGDAVVLVGDQCGACGELFFPQKTINFCSHCHQEKLGKTQLSREGKILTRTVVYQPPAGGFYHGPVPYAYGIVELPEKIKIETLFTGCELEDIIIGQKAALVIEGLFNNQEGEEVITYKFVPKTD